MRHIERPRLDLHQYKRSRGVESDGGQAQDASSSHDVFMEVRPPPLLTCAFIGTSVNRALNQRSLDFRAILRTAPSFHRTVCVVSRRASQALADPLGQGPMRPRVRLILEDVQEQV